MYSLGLLQIGEWEPWL